MKKILKYLLVPVLIGGTTLSVVACGTSQPVWNQDILNSAVGRMQDHIFNMKSDLNMTALPSSTDGYSDLTLAVQNRINSYYSDLVKPGVNWDNPSVSVTLKGENDALFLKRYGNSVEARIILSAHLTYQSLSTDTNIVVKINNDTTTEQVKIDAIGDYLATYLDQAPVFYFQTLFKNHLMSDDGSVRYLDFEAPLRTALFKETTEANPIPVIDVAGVDITVTGPASATEIYTLDNPAVTTVDNTNVIQGKLSNLSLVLHDQGVANKIITGKTLTIAQRISDASTQITTMLNQGQQVLQFKQGTLPETTPGNRPPTLEDYFNGAGANLKTNVQTTLFNIISKFYPSANMGGTIDSWSSAQIAFPNASSSPYVKINDTHGYFLANISFIVKIADATTPVTVESLVYNIKLNLTQGTS